MLFLHDSAGSAAAGTSLFHAFRELGAHLFARHFDQPQSRQPYNIGLIAVALECIAQRIHDLLLMLRALHVDKVDDDDAAQVAQADLPGNFDRSFAVHAENRVLQVQGAYKFAGIDVNDGERLGLIDVKIATVFKPYLVLQSLIQPAFDAVSVEYGQLPFIWHDAGFQFR